jgi:hypothetical protein
VAHQRQQREHGEIENNRRQPKHPLAADQAHCERRHGKGNELDDIAMGDPRPFAKHGDECQQVDCERYHPQERRRRDIRR